MNVYLFDETRDAEQYRPDLFLFEFDEPFCGQVFLYAGQKYVIDCIHTLNKVARASKIELDPEREETIQEHELTCPVCGYKNPDSWELSESDDAHDCGHCGAVLSFERIVDVSYTARVVEQPEVTEIKGVEPT